MDFKGYLIQIIFKYNLNDWIFLDTLVRYRYARYYARHRHTRHYALSYDLVAVSCIVVYRRTHRRARSRCHIITIWAAIKVFARLLQSHCAALTLPRNIFALQPGIPFALRAVQLETWGRSSRRRRKRRDSRRRRRR
jgi:hypothetical protein